ncbi:MAG: 2Fe-2S iron-sulfur cluster-binding protein, partial [Terriglobia bacterium]
MPKVTFLPDDRTVEVRVGENLLRAAMAAEVYLNAPCAGEGTCGRCKVIVRSGRVDVAEAASGQSHGVTPEEAKEGYVLACLANVVEDTGVEVPLETRLGRPPEGQPERKQAGRMLPAETWNEARAGYEADPPFKKFCFELSPPTLDDYLADYERVCRELKVGSNVTVTGADLNVLRKIPSVLREAEWQVTATVRGDPEQATLAQVEPGDSCGDKFALGIDVG